MPRSTINGTAIDLDGKEMILDADQDTTLTVDTDDQIDFKIGGSDIFTLTSSGISLTGNIVFADNDLQIQSGAQDHGLFLAGGNASNDGANISLGGPSRSSLANVTRFRQDTAESPPDASVTCKG